MNKKQLYESIMKNVSYEIKKTLYETSDISLREIIKNVAKENNGVILFNNYDDKLICKDPQHDKNSLTYYLAAIDENGNVYFCPKFDFRNYKYYRPVNIDELNDKLIKDIWNIVYKYYIADILY